jgi:hypothetical protein
LRDSQLGGPMVSCTFSFVNIDLHMPGVEHVAATSRLTMVG